MRTDTLLYTLLSNCSISALNISLHLNSVGTYQVRLCSTKVAGSIVDSTFCQQFAKLLMLPCTYFLEVFAFGKPVSSRHVTAIILVLLGVGSACVTSFIVPVVLELTPALLVPVAECPLIFRQLFQGCAQRSSRLCHPQHSKSALHTLGRSTASRLPSSLEKFSSFKHSRCWSWAHSLISI